MLYFRKRRDESKSDFPTGCNELLKLLLVSFNLVRALVMTIWNYHLISYENKSVLPSFWNSQWKSLPMYQILSCRFKSSLFRLFGRNFCWALLKRDVSTGERFVYWPFRDDNMELPFDSLWKQNRAAFLLITPKINFFCRWNWNIFFIRIW